MTELKRYTSSEIEEIDDALLEASEDGTIKMTRVYIASEADSVMESYEKRIKELEAENNTLKADIEVLNDDCRIAKENEVKYHKAYLNELDENARLKAQVPKWVSVNDRLPEDLDEVLVYDEGSIYVAELHNFHGKKIWASNWSLSSAKKTHWMPLPPKPTTEESSEKLEEAE